MMKKILLAAALVAAACSCTKEGAARFEGYYSYKLSGNISFEATTPASSDVDTAPDNMTFSISPESGQLNILTEDKKSGAVVLTMNALGGDAVAVTGKAEDSSLTLDDILIIRFTASGSMDYLGRSYVVSGSEINCVARLNDR